MKKRTSIAMLGHGGYAVAVARTIPSLANVDISLASDRLSLFTWCVDQFALHVVIDLCSCLFYWRYYAPYTPKHEIFFVDGTSFSHLEYKYIGKLSTKLIISLRELISARRLERINAISELIGKFFLTLRNL